MQWIEPEHTLTPSDQIMAKLARMASERNPNSPWSKLAQANTAFAVRDYAKAAKLFEAAASEGAAAKVEWAKLARCYLEAGRPDDALVACERGFAIENGQSFDLNLQAGIAHQILGNAEVAKRHVDDAKHGLLNADKLSDANEACWHILHERARAHDAPAVLSLCDELEARFGKSAIFTANRALAYSMMGDERSARRLVDLDQHVRVGNISEFFSADIQDFNAALSREAIEIAAVNGSADRSLVPYPDLAGFPTIQTLQAITRTAIETYLSEACERGLENCLPLPLERAMLSTGTTLLRRDARNGQHIHRSSTISVVYHIDNPAKDAEKTGAGALQIGPADQYAGGHVACWGERRVLPQPGQLTIFPAHFFHDVIPTGADDYRISFPSDVLLVD